MSLRHLKNHEPESQVISKLNRNENGIMTIWIDSKVYLIENVNNQLVEECICVEQAQVNFLVGESNQYPKKCCVSIYI